MVRPTGFEPVAPRFIPLKLSQPSLKECSWSGLSLHHRRRIFEVHRCCPSSLYTFLASISAGLGTGLPANSCRYGFPVFEQIHIQRFRPQCPI